MNLEDVIDHEYGLQQDDWSLSKPSFGDEGQLEVVGWSGRGNSHAKYYILKCNNCSQDVELFGEGYFKSAKSALKRGSSPCGCSKKPEWSKEQYSIICSRKTTERGYTFLGFEGGWNGHRTLIKQSCEKHGEWSSTTISMLLDRGYGCKHCQAESSRERNTKPEKEMIASFFASGAFHPDTKFWRSDKKDSRGTKLFWYMDCPECGEVGESQRSNLQQGKRPCACSHMRQQECYINWLIDDDNTTVAIKFGIANNSKRRIKRQNRHSVYTLKQHSVYEFPDVDSCKKAERECKQTLECGIVLKRDMSDGYTETTWVYNLDKIIEIYERNGGVKIENTN